jgi:hypothetical protein
MALWPKGHLRMIILYEKKGGRRECKLPVKAIPPPPTQSLEVGVSLLRIRLMVLLKERRLKMRTFLGIAAGISTLYIGGLLANEIFTFIISIELVERFLSLNVIIEAVALFILAMVLYTAPYAVGIFVAYKISDGKIPQVAISVIYIAACLYFAFYFSVMVPFRPAATVFILCALNAGNHAYGVIKD